MMEERNSGIDRSFGGKLSQFTWKEAAVVAALVLILSPVWQPFGWMEGALAEALSAFAAPWLVRRLDGWSQR